MLKLFKITCISTCNRRTSYKEGLTDKDVEIFEQYIFPQNIVAVCTLREEDKLPNAECLIVLAGNTFQTTEPILELVERINEAVKDAI